MKLNFFTKIKTFFKNLWWKYYKKGNFERQKEKEKTNLKNQNVQDFEKKYFVNYDKVLSLIKNERKNFYVPKNDYHNEKLVEGAKNINSNKHNISPFFFEPEICNIHNENLDTMNNLDVRTLIKNEHVDSLYELKKQENKLNNKSLFRYMFFKNK